MDQPPASGAANLLVVEDDRVTLRNMKRVLQRAGHRVTPARGGGAALDALADRAFDLVLTDLLMEPVDGMEVLARSRVLDPSVPVVIVTGHGSVKSAIRAIKRGAFHYLQKPVNLDELRHVVDLALEKRRLDAQVQRLDRCSCGGLPEILGASHAIASLKRKIGMLANSDVNVLITGPSGTGKELVASAIHCTSARAPRRFVAVNCASFSDDLVANEFFGHEKDAYTGATARKAGLLESAHGGTLFLDEVGDMPLAMQAKLLRVIQGGEFLRVGGSTPVKVDVRYVAATNKDIKRAVQRGAFREDLYYRLNVVPIHLPPLSDRREDIPVLARHFLERINRRTGKEVLGFSREVIVLLGSYAFPGNVRELENLVEGGAAMCDGEVVEMEHLPVDLTELEVLSVEVDPARVRTLDQVENDYIQQVLSLTGHNKSRAARLLGIDRVSLYRKLRRRNLKKDA